MPSSGKTTVAEGLAGRLGLPLIAKDEIKESLYEYPLTGSGSVPTEIVSDESAGITDETQVFVINLGGESFVVAGSAGQLVSEDH